ncbi:response regulator transcription factor [Hydrogenophaga laconesensis]|uniref:DNA-binding NarL/FixJ family response regulator n=1 Tax=Hydrogenophaga laconesensis TaxID=1805971 RepID=A0ABU1VFV8_9BURK|nr:DNA-binding response regulator [Hydrogenophaga laconesensis]MDR7096351.1 DNA-binding NarL/FixJ family response regulator [Hydrogenophaga laconesensis]
MTSTTDPVAAPPPAATQPVILVVDDAVDTLRMLGDALVAEGYVVLAARDAAEALERFEVAVPDGVLLDAVMPGMDGFEFCERIKATPTWSHVPIVFMTGLSESDQILRGFACGGVDYVVKPLRIPEVMARLATHVRNARVARLAQEAVDVAGMGTVVLDTQGRMAWRSPQATAWLDLAFGQGEGASQRAGEWLGSALNQPETTRDLGRQGRLLARHMGQGNLGEAMLLLTLMPPDSASASAQRLRDIALTPRETEVLSWLAKGKTNRDIADILGMSPRTVNKHLEHVFEKLGVETRSAAAAIAGRLLPQD